MHRLQCQCGSICANIDSVGTSNRIICYCTDCRAFARFLARPDVLDARGGTEIIQVAQSRVRITHGKERLAAIRLTENGMVRWYASCCRTRIGNTMINPKMGFIGLVHSCLDHSQLTNDFGQEVALVNTDAAIGDPKPKQHGLLRSIRSFLLILTKGLLSGGYRKSSLFTQSGLPVVAPQILTTEQLGRLKSAG